MDSDGWTKVVGDQQLITEEIKARVPLRSGGIGGLNGTIARSKIADVIVPGRSKTTAAAILAPFE